MGDKIQIKTMGLNAALHTLERLPKEVAQTRTGGPVRQALGAAARKLRDALRAAAPVDTGALRDSITSRRSGDRGYGQGELFVVGPKGVKRKYGNSRYNRARQRAGKTYEAEGPTFYGRFLESGTKRIPARHWMRQAGSSVAGMVITTGQDELVKRVEKLAAALNASGGKD